MVDGPGQAHARPVKFFVAEGLLEKGEESPRPRESQCHGAQLAHDLVPSLGWDVLGRPWDVEDRV